MQTSSVKSTSFADDTTQKDQQDLSAAFKNATNKVTDSVSDQDADDYVDSSKYAEDYSK